MLLLALAVLASEPTVTLTHRMPLSEDCNRRLSPAAGAPAGDVRRKLGDLPPGRAVLAVNKSVHGCPVTVLMERGPDGERRMTADPAGVHALPASEPEGRLQRRR